MHWTETTSSPAKWTLNILSSATTASTVCMHHLSASRNWVTIRSLILIKDCLCPGSHENVSMMHGSRTWHQQCKGRWLDKGDETKWSRVGEMGFLTCFTLVLAPSRLTSACWIPPIPKCKGAWCNIHAYAVRQALTRVAYSWFYALCRSKERYIHWLIESGHHGHS